MKVHQIGQVQEKSCDRTGFLGDFNNGPVLADWFESCLVRFHKSTRVRWMLAIGWWAFGLLLVFGNFHGMGDPPPPIVLIGYPIGIVIGGIFWAGVYQVIGWFCVRIWRFFRKRK